MRESERTIHCPDGYAIHLALEFQVVIGTCEDISDEPIIIQNLVLGPEQHIRCDVCEKVFGCVGRDELSMEEKQQLFTDNPGHRGRAIAERAFESFYLDMDETQEPVIPKLITP